MHGKGLAGRRHTGRESNGFEWPQAGGCQIRATATRVSQSSLPRGGINFAFKKLCYKQVGSLVLCNIVCLLPGNVCRKVQVNVFLRCDKVCVWYDAASVCPPLSSLRSWYEGKGFFAKWLNFCFFYNHLQPSTRVQSEKKCVDAAYSTIKELCTDIIPN